MQSQGRRRLDNGSQDVDSSRKCDLKIHLEEGFRLRSNIYLQWPFKDYKYFLLHSIEFLKTYIYPMFTYLLYYFRFVANWKYKCLKRINMSLCINSNTFLHPNLYDIIIKIHLSISILYIVYKLYKNQAKNKFGLTGR